MNPEPNDNLERMTTEYAPSSLEPLNPEVVSTLVDSGLTLTLAAVFLWVGILPIMKEMVARLSSDSGNVSKFFDYLKAQNQELMELHRAQAKQWEIVTDAVESLKHAVDSLDRSIRLITDRREER